MNNQYAQRDHRALGEHYLRHVSAMTGEGLHAKSDIAAELAWRDAEIERLTGCLKKANDSAEHFEREWYLRGDEIERLRALTICGCGDHFNAAFRGLCPNCVAAGKVAP